LRQKYATGVISELSSGALGGCIDENQSQRHKIQAGSPAFPKSFKYLFLTRYRWVEVTSRLTTHTKISLNKQQFVVTHTIRQTEIPALLNGLVTNTPSVKILYPQKKKISSPYIFVKT